MQDEDRQTQQAFDAVTGEAMALTPPRVEDQEAGRRERERLTLESVPFFDRPIHSRPDDRIVGQDEFGRPVYETITGNRYTISLNPDQRTTRARIEEDVVPAIQSYMQDPSLPTAQQVADFAVGAVKGAYESLEGSMQGRGTYGDVFGLAVGSGAGSMFGEVPEGALRIFGGFRAARDPGVDASGNPLPRSVGADELERFEIDDSQASFNPERVPQQSMSSLNNQVDRQRIAQNPEQYFARLDQVLDHPELFRQYPVLGGLRVVEDTSIDPRAGGYYDASQNLLAVSPNTMRDPDFFRRVIVHEVQHAVQELEGFDRGTNPQSPEVTGRSAVEIDEAQRMQDEAFKQFQEFDFESRLDEVRDFMQSLLNDIDEEGLVTADQISFTSPHRAGWTQTLEDLATTLEDDTLQGFDAYDALLDFYAFVRENPQIVPEESLEDFTDTFKISVDELSNLSAPIFIDQFEEFGIVPIDPQRLSFLESDIRERTYTSRSGEVEATNVMDRLGYSLAQRFSEPPEQTEKIMRAEQWRVDPSGRILDSARQFNTGGVVSMEEQMSLFDMGGLTDDGAMRDPVSGNEVPPGSMASEVRDDVPAMLSEGEYIVPADVVRYYGVKFFEDLRSQAKSGLMDMERNGRIGGEPVPMGGPQGEGELTPEEMAMLAEITGMYGGGMVRKGYQTGGVVAPMTQQDFMNQAEQANQFQLPSSVFTPATPTTAPAQQPTFTPVALYGPSGDVILATTQDQYNQLLSQGYTTQPRTTAPTTTQESGGDRGGIEEPEVTTGGGFSLSDENRQALAEDPLSFGKNALEESFGLSSRQMAGAGSLLGGMPGMVVGGLAGAAMELDNVAKAQAALQVAASRGLENTPEYAALNASVKTAIENLSGPARLLNRLGLASGDRYAASVEGMTPTTPRTTPTGVRSGGGGTSLAPTTSPRPTPRPDRGEGSSSSADDSRREAVESARRGSEQVISAAERNLATRQELDTMREEARKAEEKLGDIRSGRNTTGRVGFEKGGLVAKPSRKKPVAKKK